MKVAQIIRNNSWLSVETVFLKLYPDQKGNISAYEDVFNDLKFMEPAETDMSIQLSWEKDEFDGEEYVDVSGYGYNQVNENGPANSMALEFTPWEEWMGMDVDKQTLRDFTELEIISHCLYEMTFVSFDQKEIQAKMDELKRMADEIDNISEEEKKARFKSWEDLKKELEEDNGDED